MRVSLRNYNYQEYKVVAFAVVAFQKGKWVSLGLQAERALFPEWTIDEYTHLKDGPASSEDVTHKSKTYPADPLYNNLKVGEIISGNIISFLAIFDLGSESGKVTINYVQLNPTENPLKKIVKKINHFPFYLIDFKGQVFYITSKLNVPSWP